MATYFVKNGGSDGADGLSDANAWATAAKVNGSSFTAGDVIQFRRGHSWRERLIAPSSGSSAALPILFTAYGSSGARPIFDGSDIKTGWAPATPPRYSVALTTQCHMVFVDGVLAVKGASEATLNNGEWFWAANVLYYRSDAGNPDTVPLLMEATIREATGNEGIIEFNGKSWVTFDNLVAIKGNAYGIHSYAATPSQTGKVTRNCRVSYTASGGICYIADSEFYTGSIIARNELDHLNMQLPWGAGNSEAITMQHADGFYIGDNALSACMEEAIDAFLGSKNGEIAYNRVSGYIGLGTRPAIYFGECTDTVVHDNFVTGQTYAPSPFAEAYRIVNAFVEMAKQGIYFTSGLLDNLLGTNEIRNNIFHQCLVNAIQDDTTGNQAIGLFAISHNFFTTGGSSETQGSNAVIAADPLFVAAGDFALQSGSPCLNAGIPIAGINDGFWSSNPDLGPIERYALKPRQSLRSAMRW